MNRDLPLAIAFAAAVHLLVVGVTLFRWQADAEVMKPDVPPHVKAVVVEREPEPPSPPRPEPEPAPKPEPEPRPEPEPDKESVSTEPEPEPEPEREPEPESEPPEQHSFEQPSLEEMLAREELEMEQVQKEKAIEAEPQSSETAEGETTDEELARQITAIRNAVARHWNRPPGARNNMKTVLRLRLLPGGEVVEVTVVESSGNVPLDRSTVAAVKNASPLPVPSGKDFNRFREFRMSFKPEDLSL